MICPKCGQMVPDASKFCQSCGAKLLEASIDEAAGVEKSVQDIVDPPKEEAPVAEAPAQEVADEPAVEEKAEAQASAGAPAAEEKAEAQETAEAPAASAPDVSEAEPAAEMAMAGASTQTMEAPTAENVAAPQMEAGAGAQFAAAGGTAVKKGLPKPALFGIIGGGVFLVAAAITMVIVFLIVGTKETYRLADYTDVKFEGVDGSGTAKASINEDLMVKIAEANGMDLSQFKNKDNIDWGDAMNFASSNFSDIMKIASALQSIQLDLDKKDNLKNGDTVTVTYSFDPEKAKEVKAEFIGDPLTVTVSGLSEVKEVDPFEGLTVSFEGTSPNAYVSYDYKSTEDWGGMIYFTVDRSDGLREGDTVSFRVEGYDENRFVNDYGVRFSQLDKTYTVENVEAFLTENKEIDSAALDIMKQATEEYVKQYFSEASRKDSIKASDISYEGYYFLTNKQTNVWYGVNKVYMVYSATVSSKEKQKKFKPKKVFFPVEYDDVKHLADGNYEINTAYKRILGSTDLRFGYWEVVSGYTDKKVMFDELITADSATYDGVAYDALK